MVIIVSKGRILLINVGIRILRSIFVPTAKHKVTQQRSILIYLKEFVLHVENAAGVVIPFIPLVLKGLLSFDCYIYFSNAYKIIRSDFYSGRQRESSGGND